MATTAPFPEPTADQQNLIDIVGAVYLAHGEWPGWAYVEESMERSGLSAASVLASVPKDALNYGYVWPIRAGAPLPQDRVGLTVAALSRVAGAEHIVDSFLRLVGAMGTIRAGVQLDPFAETRPTVTRAEIVVITGELSPDEWSLLEMMQREPPTWHCQPNRLAPEDWTIELAPQIRRFAAITDVGDYLARLHEFTIPTAQAPEPQPVSPFTLPAAIDYLDVVWQLRFGKALVVRPGVERSARLAFTATSPEEADNRLSALAELLKNLQVPGVTDAKGGHPLQRLGPYLLGVLPEEAHERVRQAVGVCDAAQHVRAAAQHQSAQLVAMYAYELLRLGYPVADWSAAG
jgi:hypothetical protein